MALAPRSTYLRQEFGIRQDPECLLERVQVSGTDDDCGRSSVLRDRHSGVLGLDLLYDLRPAILHFRQRQLISDAHVYKYG